MSPTVIYEDNHLLVVDKPAGLPTAGVTGRASAYQWAGQYLKERYQKPGNVYVGVVSRLDTVTSGVLVLARTSKAASRLSEQIRSATWRKYYLAIVRDRLAQPTGHLADQLFKDDAAHRMRVASAGRQEKSQLAELNYCTLHQWSLRGETLALLAVELITGRKHQIRVQLASRRAKIWGDRKYGDTAPLLGQGIGLHAYQLHLTHPTRKESLRFTCPPPKVWQTLLPPEWSWEDLKFTFPAKG